MAPSAASLPPPQRAPDWSVAVLIVGFVLVGFLIGRFATPSPEGGGLEQLDSFRQAFPAAAAAADRGDPNGAGIVPPGWVFGLVWGLLYAAMGVSLWFALRDAPRESKGSTYAIWVAGLVFFAVGTALNWAWMPVFVSGADAGGGESGGSGERNALWILVAALAATAVAAVLFVKSSIPAAACLVPLLVWYVYALLLNVRVVERSSSLPSSSHVAAAAKVVL